MIETHLNRTRLQVACSPSQPEQLAAGSIVDYINAVDIWTTKQTLFWNSIDILSPSIQGQPPDIRINDMLRPLKENFYLSNSHS